MSKTYNQISALGLFSCGFCTEYLDFTDGMEWRQFDGGVAYNCPEKPDFWFGHGVNLFASPSIDVKAEYLTELWDSHVAPHAPKACKRVVIWEADEAVNYPNLLQDNGCGCKVLLKYSSDTPKTPRAKFNVNLIEPKDFQQMVEIYVADAGEAQREHTEWTVKNRFSGISDGQAHFFAIWNVDDSEIAAIAGLYWHKGIYRYASVTTRKAYRGRGYATALIAHIRDYALENSAQEIYIMADDKSQAAGIYMNAGFEIYSYMYTWVANR